MKVVVIGAGPVGLVTLTNFQRLFKPDELEIVCYERRGQVGGEWFDMMDQDETYDKLGLPMRTSIYEELQMNTPALLYPLYPNQEFPNGTSLFPKRAEMYNYLKTLSENHNLERNIHFHKMVSDIAFDKETSTFSMKVHDLKTEDVKDESCDYLLLCVGKFTLPRKPDIDMSKFTGEWLHYHEMRDPKRMYGKRILAVGNSWGAMDMAILLNKPGRAKSLHLSYRRARPIFESGANLTSVHNWPISAEGKTVRFQDGSSVEVDTVIFANGYVPFHPLSKDLQLNFETSNPASRFLNPLYKDIVHPKCPRLFVIGITPFTAMHVAHPQSIFISKVMKGEFVLPSEAEMENDIAEFHQHWTKELLKTRTEEELDSYVPLLELALTIGNFPHEMCSDVPRMGPEYMRHLYYQTMWGIRKDCLNYKNYVHEFRADPDDPGKMIPYLLPSAK